MYDKIAKAQNKKEEIAMREAIKMMQGLLYNN